MEQVPHRRGTRGREMASFYDEVEIEDMVFDEARDAYFYPCPCGDKFVITVVRVRRFTFAKSVRFHCTEDLRRDRRSPLTAILNL